MTSSDVLFDASAYPDFEKNRRQNILVWNLILISSIIIWPLMIAVIYFIAPEENFEGGLSKSTLILIFFLIMIVDVVAMIFMKKKVTDRFCIPVRITSQGLELSKGYAVLASEIKKIRIDTEGSIGIYKEGKSFPIRILSKRQLGNSDEFIRILKEQNPFIEIEDINETARKYIEDRKARKRNRNS